MRLSLSFEIQSLETLLFWVWVMTDLEVYSKMSLVPKQKNSRLCFLSHVNTLILELVWMIASHFRLRESQTKRQCLFRSIELLVFNIEHDEGGFTSGQSEQGVVRRPKELRLRR